MQVLTILAQALIAATQVIFARLYGQLVYGSYVSALAIVEVLNRGGTGGADKSMLRYVAAARASGDAAGVKSAIGTGLRLGMFVGGSFGLVLAFAGPVLARAFHQPSMQAALQILSPVPLLTGCLWILIQATLAARVTRANFLVRGLAEPSLLLAGGVVGWMLGGGIRALALAHVCAALTTLVLAIFVVRRVLPSEEISGVLAAPRRPGLTSFALPMAMGEMLNAVVQRADLLILTSMSGLEAAAVYGAADFITRSIANIRYAFDSVLAGVLSETLHMGQLDRLRYNLRLTTRWVITVAAPIAVTLMVLRTDLLVTLFGGSYATGSAALIALAGAHLVSAAFGLTGWVLMVAGHSRIGLYNNLACAAFNVPSAYFLTKRLGPPGAACAALATSLMMQGLALVEVAYLTKVHPFSRALLKPVAATATMLGVELIVQVLVPPIRWVRMSLVIATGLLGYGAALWFLRLPDEEVRLLQRVLRVSRRER